MSKYTILLVDDAEDNLFTAEAVLIRKGYSTLSASSGVEALGIVKKYPVDLILLDIMMPELSGYETCRQLKQNSQTATIPIIFLTAVTENIEQGFEVGGVDYIVKPFKRMELLARVQTHLALAELQQAQMDLIAQLSAKNAELTRQHYRFVGIAEMLHNYQQIPLQYLQRSLLELLRKTDLPQTETKVLMQQISDTCVQLVDFGNALVQLTADKKPR